MARRKLFSWVATIVGALVAFTGLFGYAVFSQRRRDEVLYQLYVAGTYLPEYRAQHGRWPSDLSEADPIATGGGEQFGPYMAQIRQRSGARLKKTFDSATLFEGELAFSWWPGGTKVIRCDEECIKVDARERKAYERGSP